MASPRLRSGHLHPLDRPPQEAPWNSDELLDLLPEHLAEAAVLVGLIERPAGQSVLLTRRTDSMRQHAGQIAFPGGRRDPGDRDLVAAALRETEEEVGIGAPLIEPLGFLDPYATITGFRVTPVLARIDPGYQLRLEAAEVAEAFEVPLTYLLDPANSEQVGAEFRGRMRHYWQIHFGRYRIWGATAAMILNLRRFFESEH
ncbi:CoA pyrophosphatase [Lysobacter sp. CAU 1642]|uniref:CoA pyrophosphatase n=1 Tax=Pseudomarimonas salicorniae TaxID=2933270 RepID=A0ABT0GL50_9GAMM|nr:CoA pyrophosphatase [Lysobacter sp. CAU 1642]MCK7595271.1 CoA pyrophosphatase [Lysobacter sp. CAU 1642]